MWCCQCYLRALIDISDWLYCVMFARNIVSRFSTEQIDRIVDHILNMKDKVRGSEMK